MGKIIVKKIDQKTVAKYYHPILIILDCIKTSGSLFYPQIFFIVINGIRRLYCDSFTSGEEIILNCSFLYASFCMKLYELFR